MLLVLMLASMLAVAVGCGKKEETTTISPPETTMSTLPPETTTTTLPPETTTTLFDIHSVTSSTEPETTTSTTEALSSAETRLPSGHIKAMGYITRVWESSGKRWIEIDYAEFVHDRDEMTRLAREAGEIGPDEEWDLEYYIKNLNPQLRTFQVSDSVVITTSTRWVPGDDWEAPCTWADFMSFWGPGPFPESEGHLHAVPWWIERAGRLVVRIDEQYLP